MPTEDYSHTRRIARVRQIAEWKGLNKVVGALSSGTQLSMKVGGVVDIQKSFNGIGKTINRGDLLLNNNISQYTIPSEATIVNILFIDPDVCINKKTNYTMVFLSLDPTKRYIKYSFDRPSFSEICKKINENDYGIFYTLLSIDQITHEIILPYRPTLTTEDIKNIFPQIRNLALNEIIEEPYDDNLGGGDVIGNTNDGVDSITKRK